MAVTLNLEPELAAKLEALAQTAGQSLKEYLEHLLEHKYYAGLAAKAPTATTAVAREEPSD